MYRFRSGCFLELEPAACGAGIVEPLKALLDHGDDRRQPVAAARWPEGGPRAGEPGPTEVTG